MKISIIVSPHCAATDVHDPQIIVMVKVYHILMECYSVCTELSNLQIEIKGFAKIYTVLIQFKATL